MKDSLEGKEGEVTESVDFSPENSIKTIYLENTNALYKKLELKIEDFFDKKINENINFKYNIEELKKTILDVLQESLKNNWEQKINLIIKEISEIKKIIEKLNIKYNIKNKNIINSYGTNNSSIFPKINIILDDITAIKNDINVIINKLIYNKDINDNKKEKNETELKIDSYLRDNHIFDELVEKNLKKVKRLDLSCNIITNLEGLKKLEIINLETLVLSNNRINDI